MDQFSGRVAVITGAGSGMGQAFAARFAAAGMKIVAADIQADALAAVADLLAEAIRREARYLLTDHDWDEKIRQRHEAILAGAVGPVSSGVSGVSGVSGISGISGKVAAR